MEAFVSPSIILRTKEIGESDLLVTFFTADQGLLKGIAKGARRSRKRFVSCLDHFSFSALEYTVKSGRDLCFLQSCRLLEHFPALRSSYALLSLASYMVELVEILSPLHVPDPSMFALLKQSFGALGCEEHQRVIRALFEARSMAIGGYRIQLKRCCRCGREYKGEGRAVFECSRGAIACLGCGKETDDSPGLSPPSVAVLERVQSGWDPQEESFDLTETVMREIRSVLKKHIEYRIGRRLKTSAYLE